MKSETRKWSLGAWGGWGGWGQEARAAEGAGPAAVVSSAALLAAVALLLPLPPHARIEVWRGAALFALGLVHFSSLFVAAAALLARRAQRLTRAAQLDVANKAVSGVQALWSSAAGGAVCGYACARDAAAATHFLTPAYAWFGAAYFAYDLVSMFAVHAAAAREGARLHTLDGAGGGGGGAGAQSALQPTLRSFLAHEPLMVAHHCFIGGFGFLVIVWLRGAAGDCAFGFVYLMEASTVCVSLRGVLARLGRRGALYAVNGAAMLAAFAACRLAALPYALALYARAKRLSYWRAAAGLPAGCQLSVALLLLPQVYWFYLMCRGAVRLLTRRAEKKGDVAVAGDDAGGAAEALPAAGDAVGAAGAGGARPRRS